MARRTTRIVGASATEISGAEARQLFREIDAAATNQLWDLAATGEEFLWRTRTDADAAGETILTAARTGTAVDTLTLNNGDFHALEGLVVGNASQVAFGEITSEAQVLGTTETDASLAIGLFSTTDALAPILKLMKSGHQAVGSNTTVADNEELGKIQAYGADGTDLDTLVAEIAFNVDDSSVATGQIGGEILLQTATSGGTLTTAMTIDKAQVVKVAGILGVNEDTNANMAIGLTINQGPNDTQAICLKSSDVAHGLTSGGSNAAETDDFYAIHKTSGAKGGVRVQAYMEDLAETPVWRNEAYGGQADTTKTTSGIGQIDFFTAEHDGSNGLADITANGNVFTVTARVGGANVARFLIDEDGDMFTVTSGGTFDEYDDVHLLRTFDRSRGTTIRQEWDDFVKYNEQDLIDAKILGAPVAEGGLTNVTQLQRAQNGAICQLYTQLREAIHRLTIAESKLTQLEA